jgi:hypothetical protein
LEQKNINCGPGEIFLGEFANADVERISNLIFVRRDNVSEETGNFIFDLYVQESEIKNYLHQAEMDMEELAAKMKLQSLQLDMAALASGVTVDEHMYFKDEAFVGFFKNKIIAYELYPQMDCIREGGMIDADLLDILDPEGICGAGRDEKLQYIFANKTMYEALIVSITKESLFTCEKYASLCGTYTDLKNILKKKNEEKARLAE